MMVLKVFCGMRLTSHRPVKAPAMMIGARIRLCWRVVAGDVAEVELEGNFKQVDADEKPGTGADESVFGESHGEQIDDHDRPGGVGEHGGETGAGAHADAEDFALGNFGVGGFAVAPEVDADHEQHDDADDRAELAVLREDIFHADEAE